MTLVPFRFSEWGGKMKKNNQLLTILCSETKVGDTPGFKSMCSECAVELFVSYSSLRAAEKNGIKKSNMKFQCLDCIPIEVISNSLPFTDEQIEEIRRNLK